MARISDNLLDHVEEISKQNRHRLNSCRAAYRMLQGAFISGLITKEQVRTILSSIMKFEPQLQSSGSFAETYLDDIELNREPLANQVNHKYSQTIILNDKKILVVDDQIGTTGWKQVFESLFKDNVIFANSKKQALHQVERYQKDLLCVFVDLKLPKTEDEGINLIKQISEKHEGLPLVVFSAMDSVPIARRCFQCGAWEYFPKEPESKLHKSSLQYYISFHDLVSGIVKYNKNYYDKYWSKIQTLKDYSDSKEFEQYTDLRNRIIFHLKKAYKFIVHDDIDSFSLTFGKTDYNSEVILQCTLALELFITIILQKRRISEKKLVLDENFIPKIDDTPDPNIFLGEKIKLLNANLDKTSLSRDMISKVFEFNKLRTNTVHSIRSIEKKNNKSKLTPTKKIDFKTAEAAFSDILDLLIQTHKKEL